MSCRMIIGADKAALDELARLEYKALEETYPTILSHCIPIGRDGVATVSYDIQAAPTFDLAPRPEWHAERKRRLEASLDDADPAVAEAARALLADGAESTEVEFALLFEKVRLTMKASDGSTHSWTATITARSQATVTAPDIVSLRVQSATLAFVGDHPDKTLEWLLNEAVLPVLVKDFNDNFLGSFQLPLQVPGAVFTTPVVAIQDGVLLVFVSTQQDPPAEPLPPGTSWPKGRAFVVMDRDLVDQLLEVALLTVSKAGQASMTRDGMTFAASYFLGLRRMRVGYATANPFPASFEAAGDGTLQVRAGKYTLRTARFLLRARPHFLASVAIRFPDLEVKIDAVTSQDVKVEFPWLPKPIADMLEELVDWLNGSMVTLLADLLLWVRDSLHFQIPSLRIVLPDVTLSAALRDVKEVGLIDSSGEARIGFTGFFAVYVNTDSSP